MATTDVTIKESGELGLVLEDTEWGILIEDIKESIVTQNYPQVEAGMLLTKVRGEDVSLESGKTKDAAVELLGGKQRPLDLQVQVLVKKPKETVVTLRNEGPLGMVLHDSPLGARVDHISSGVVRREAPHVRIGLVLVKVNDEDVSVDTGLTVEDIIPILLDSPRPMILTFIRPGTEDHGDDHHDFVINPMGKGAAVPDVVVDVAEEAPKDEGPQLLAYVDCQAFLDVQKFVTIHFVYEIGMIVSAVFTEDLSKTVSVLAVLGSGNIVLKGFAYHKADCVKLYMIANIIATAVGIGMAGYMLWYLVDFCEQPEPRPDGPEYNATTKTFTSPAYQTQTVFVHENVGTATDPDWQLVQKEEPKPRECKAGSTLKAFVLASALADVFMRSVGIMRATLKIQYIIDWWDEKETTEFEAAQRVQAIVRGNQGRKRLRAEKGIVTKALAGEKYKAHMYRPATPIELKVQKTLKALWDRKAGGKAKLRTFHSIRAQASQIHRIFQKLQLAFKEYDLNSNGTIELAEAEAALRDMGAVISEQEMEFLFMEAFAPPAEAFSPHRVGLKDQHRKRETDRLMPWEKREAEEGEDVLCGPSGKPWPKPLSSPPDLDSGTVDKTVNKILPNMSEELPAPAELQTWTKESQVLFWNQRDKYWNRWSHEELQQECLDHGLHPDGAMRFLKDRLMRYDFGQTNLTADETAEHGWELNEDETAWVYTKEEESEPEPEPEDGDKEKDKDKDDDEEEQEPDPNRPEVGDEVVLTHEAASQNVNNVLKLGILQPQETGLVLQYDPDSTRMHFEVKNTTNGSANYGKTAWYQDITVMKKSLVGATDGPGELTEFIMTEEEMEWARNTMTPDQLADMLSGGLDLNHFLVMMSVGFLLKVIPGKVRKRNEDAFAEYAEAFNSAIDAFIQLDEGYGVIIIQGVEAKLKEAKAGDMVTVQKLKDLDEKNSGFVAFGHFLTGFLNWMDPEMDDI